MNLTGEQIEAVKNGQPVKVTTPEAGEVVVISTDLYDHIRELLEDEEDRKLQEAWLKLTHKGRTAALDEP